MRFFKKSYSGLTRSKVGLALQKRGEQILDLVKITEKELKDLEQGTQGTLCIGSVASWGATLLPERGVDAPVRVGVQVPAAPTAALP